MGMRARRSRPLDYWPGFVDALAALLMVTVFVILIFVIGQFVFADAVSGRDRALSRLNAELAALANTLSLETIARERAELQIGELSATLGEQIQARNAETARLETDIAALAQLKAELESKVATLAGALDQTEKSRNAQIEVSDRALAQVELLNRQLAAVRTQLDQLNNALASAEKIANTKDIRIEELGRELNIALAARVQELDRYRSEFFGRLRSVLGKRENVQVVGDRFVFSSEVLFPSASDEVSEEGLRQLMRLAETLKDIAADIPPELPWVLQVDGHTDRRPIATARFPSNWELSTARALAIVKFLRAQGIPAQRLAATGYGEFHPLAPRDSDEAYARNRRIELKLTSR